jgi:CRP/FNR family transcriptional regulator, cyclic AMP receptor protein
MRDDIEAFFHTSLGALVLHEAHWQALLPLCRVRRLVRGQVLFTQGEPTGALWGTLSGEVEIRFSSMDGDRSVVEHVPAGRLFGLASFASGEPSSFEALATRPTRVLAFGPAAYEYLMDEVPGFARALMREFAQRHHGALRLLEASRHRSPMERLSLALEQLARSGRAEAVHQGWRPVQTTQAELAALAHLSRQTVNTLLGELAAAGRVRKVYGGVWLRV